MNIIEGKLKPEKIGFYAKSLRSSIPKSAQKPATYKLIFMFSYLVICFGLMFVASQYENYIVVGLIGAVTGIPFASLFTYCHELSHGTIVRKRAFLYPLEIIFWSVNYMPPTVWKIVHNQTHHATANTYNDPDRKTYKSEANKTNFIYNLFIYPNKKIRYSLTVGFAMILYTWKHTLSAFYPEKKKPKILTFKPFYSKKDQKKILFELVFIVAFQVLIYLIIGSFLKYIIFVLSAYILASSVMISLVITQHLANPNFKNLSDPVVCTTSIVLPKYLDFIIDYHSYHTEHHIFPNINFDYYPQVSKELESSFPDKYNRMPFLKAIKLAYDEDVYIDDPLT